MNARIIKGGWWHLGVEQHVGQTVTGSEQWIANRAADGLVEPITEPVPAIETAVSAPVETAMQSTPRASHAKKERKG